MPLHLRHQQSFYTRVMIQGLVQIFIFQALGELLSKFALPFIPGPVIGLVLLLAFLSLRGHVPASIDLVGSSVLQHLGLLFIPASVGVVLYLPILQANAWAIASALVISVLATIAVTASLLKVFAKKRLKCKPIFRQSQRSGFTYQVVPCLHWF
jgi:putative effector of murein hydrolase LrgA (UPF0299 family)